MKLLFSSTEAREKTSNKKAIDYGTEVWGYKSDKIRQICTSHFCVINLLQELLLISNIFMFTFSGSSTSSQKLLSFNFFRCPSTWFNLVADGLSIAGFFLILLATCALLFFLTYDFFHSEGYQEWKKEKEKEREEKARERKERERQRARERLEETERRRQETERRDRERREKEATLLRRKLARLEGKTEMEMADEIIVVPLASQEDV